MPSAEAHRLDAIAAVEAVDPDAEADVDARVAVDRGHRLPDLAAEHAPERDRQRLDQGDLETPLATGGRDLGADEPGTDDDDSPRRPVEVGAERDGVVEGAQHVHTAEPVAAGEGAG